MTTASGAIAQAAAAAATGAAAPHKRSPESANRRKHWLRRWGIRLRAGVDAAIEDHRGKGWLDNCDEEHLADCAMDAACQYLFEQYEIEYEAFEEEYIATVKRLGLCPEQKGAN